MPNETSRWTVGIPTFNRPDYLFDSLSSALRQQSINPIVIVSDNASSIKAETLVSSWGYSGDSVNHIRHEKQVLPAENFLSILDECKTVYFSWLQDDDCLFNTFGRDCISLLDDHPGSAGCLAFAVRSQNITKMPWGKSTIWGTSLELDILNLQPRVVQQYSLVPWLSYRSQGFSPVAVFRTDLLKRAVKHLMKDWQDLILNSYFFEHAIMASLNKYGSIIYIPKVLGILRAHDGNVSRKINLKDRNFRKHYSILLSLLESLVPFDRQASVHEDFSAEISRLSTYEKSFYLDRLSSVESSYANYLLSMIGSDHCLEQSTKLCLLKRILSKARRLPAFR